MEYPWITFELDLRAMPPSFWVQLGEVRSKCSHLAHVPLPRAYAEQLHRVSLAKGVHATTAIEGNTLSESDVEALIAEQPVPGAPEYQVREVQNVIDAHNWVLGELGQGRRPKLTPKLIAEFNRQVLDGLDGLGDHVAPGKYRTDSVVVGPYRAPDWQECPDLVQRLCDWLNGPSFSDEGALRIPLAVIRASLAHLYIAWVHPFGDGNGRTARLCEYLVLVTSGVPTSAAHLIANHCNTTRDEYYRQLWYASESGGDVERFLEYCADGLVEGLESQLAWIYDRQLRLTWQEYVALQVTGRDPQMRSRRQQIAEALLFRPPVSKREVPKLTPELSGVYATCGHRTLSRDLNALVESGLIVVGPDGYQANTEVLLTLLPFVAPPTAESE